MKNKLINVLAAVVLLVVVVLGYQLIHKQKVVEEEKSITITAIDYRVDPPLYIIENQTFSTTSNYLGELLDEINLHDQTFLLTGSKTDLYGRILEAIKDSKQNPSANQYWLYESSNNKECKAAGFCNGVDKLPIQDSDIFIFSIK